MAVIVVGALIAVGSIVLRALDARDKLEAAIPLVSEVQTNMLAGDVAAAEAAADQLVTATSSARAGTSGTVWRAFEWVPVAGPNLHAVRTVAAAVDELAVGAVQPAASLSLQTFRPVDGRIDLSAVEDLGAVFAGAKSSLEKSTALIASIDRTQLLGPVSGGVDRLDSALQSAQDLVEPAQPLVDALPAMLGADGPRDVLVIIQNNGEVMPRGGTIGSLAQLHIEDGAISLVAQASASPTDIPMYDEDVVPIAADVRQTYEFGLGRYVQNLTRTPRFDLTFDIAREIWKRSYGVEVDVVVALDTLAVSYLLDATGPIALPGGLELTSANAVPVLLGDLYSQYTPPEVDIINQTFAATTMTALMTGSVDTAALIGAVQRAASEGRVLIWSSRVDEQELITGSPFDGRPPAQLPGRDAFGVYFVDSTPGKMQRFMTQAVDVSQAVCAADGRRHVRVTVALTNTVELAAVDGLPDYVTGGGFVTLEGLMRIETLAYAPPGFAPAVFSSSAESDLPRVSTDGEFSVAGQRILLAPGETRVMTFDYVADDATETDLFVDVTPVVTPNTITYGRLDCAAIS